MYAVHFDGTRTIKLGNHEHFRLEGCGDFTYEMWFRPTASDVQGWIVMRNAANGIQFQGISSSPRLYHGNYCSNPRFSSWKVGTWYHLAMVGSGCTRHLYVNGVQDHSACTGVSYTNYNLDFHVGGGYAPLLKSADLAEVRVWGVTRTEAQLNTHMRTPLVVSSYSLDELRGYWRFESADDIEHDSSPWGTPGAYTPTFANSNDHGRVGSPTASDWIGSVPWPA